MNTTTINKAIRAAKRIPNGPRTPAKVRAVHKWAEEVRAMLKR